MNTNTHNGASTARQRQANTTADKLVGDLEDGDKAMFARCRLANARKWLTHRGWEVLPQSDRGQRILEWGAFHAYLASPANPKRSVRRWCRRWWPSLSATDLANLVATTVAAIERGARWSHDDSAVTLELGWSDRELLHLWHLGACDDPDYTHRDALNREKDAARHRKSRAAHSTGAKRGRPALQLSEEEMLERRKTQAADRKRAERARKRAATPECHAKIRPRLNLKTLNTVDRNIDDVTEFSVTPDQDIDGVTEFQSHASNQTPDLPSRPRQADRRQAQLPVIRQQALEGEIVLDSGVGWRPPPRRPSHFELAFRDAAIIRPHQEVTL